MFVDIQCNNPSLVLVSAPRGAPGPGPQSVGGHPRHHWGSQIVFPGAARAAVPLQVLHAICGGHQWVKLTIKIKNQHVSLYYYLKWFIARIYCWRSSWNKCCLHYRCLLQKKLWLMLHIIKKTLPRRKGVMGKWTNITKKEMISEWKLNQEPTLDPWTATKGVSH